MKNLKKYAAIILISFAVTTLIAQTYELKGQGISLPKEQISTDLTIPKSMNFQGTLYQDGSPVKDTMDMWFGIYDALSGGTLLYSVTNTNVEVINGWFSTMLTNIPNSVFPVTGPTRYLEIKAPAIGPALTPRLQLASVGYAYHAITTDTAEYAKAGLIARPITPLISGTEIAKPCTLKSSLAGGLLELKNTHASGTGIGVDSAGWVGVGINRVGAAGLWVGNSGWAGVDIDSAGDGVYVGRAGSYGVHVNRAGVDGVYVDSAGDAGFVVNRAGGSGFAALRPRWTGFYVDSAQTGVHIPNVNENGIHVNHAGVNGVFVDNAGQSGVYVDSGADCGFKVNRADTGLKVNGARYGVYIDSTHYDGINIDKANFDGIDIYETGYDGLRIQFAGWHGVVVMNAERGVWAYGKEVGGWFRADSSIGVGVEAHSYNGLIANTAIRAYGKGVATGGWLTGLDDGKEAPCIIGQDKTIIVSGTGILSNGKADINYPNIFADIIHKEIPVRISLTPKEDPSGILFVTEMKTNGFTATLKQIPSWSGKRDITFDWIAIGTLKELEHSPEVKAKLEKDMREREEMQARHEKMMKEKETENRGIEKR